MAELAEVMDQVTDAKADREGKYLTFTLAEEEYGIGILKIKEIIGMMPITPVPQTPEFVKGVINLRGKVIPVVDLRLRFGMEEIDYTERIRIRKHEISTVKTARVEPIKNQQMKSHILKAYWVKAA